MDPRPILELLIERLGPEVADLSFADYCFWGDMPPDVRERWLSGRLHLASAVRWATEALASGDADKIAAAALICPTMERTGREMSRRHETKMLAQTAEARRRAGGKARGAQQTAEAEAKWKPWQERFRALLTERRKPAMARRTVKNEMTKAGFLLPGQDKFPSDFTIRRWLK